MVKPVIFILGGKKRAGKNTVANIMERKLSGVGSVQQFSFAAELKRQVCEIRGITEEQLEEEKEKWRGELQMYGQGARAVDFSFWCRFVAKEILVAATDFSIITDYRFPNEAQYIKNVFADTHYIVDIYIDRLSDIFDSDPSEQLVAEHCSFTLNNDSDISSLPNKVDTLLGQIKPYVGRPLSLK